MSLRQLVENYDDIKEEYDHHETELERLHPLLLSATNALRRELHTSLTSAESPLGQKLLEEFGTQPFPKARQNLGSMAA